MHIQKVISYLYLMSVLFSKGLLFVAVAVDAVAVVTAAAIAVTIAVAIALATVGLDKISFL